MVPSPWRILAVATIVLLLVPRGSEAQLLTNGSFETGCEDPINTAPTLSTGSTCVTGWLVSARDIDWVDRLWLGSVGTRSIDLSGYGPGAIQQTFATTAGQAYVISFDLSGNPDGGLGLNQVRVSADGQVADFTFEITAAHSRGNMGWRRQTWTFVANDDSATLDFQSLVASAYGPVIDAVVVEPLRPAAPCFSTHTTGAGVNKPRICFTDVGTLGTFESPSAFEHVATTPAAEGYAVCSLAGTHGYEATRNGWGFGPPTVIQPNGSNTFPLTITRTTLDGAFELKQTFGRDASQFAVKITMSLKNVSAAAQSDVRLSRYFGGAMDNGVRQEVYIASPDGILGIETHGLMLVPTNLATAHDTAVEALSDWDPLGPVGTAQGCVPSSQPTPTAPGAFVGRLTYRFGRIAPGASKTVTVIYRRF